MDYSNLSDIEIDTMVSKICSPEFHRNYCNNPADAWMVIESNLLRMTPVVLRGVVNWVASRDIHAHYDTNPLRAAMIVFLKIQGSANVQDNTARDLLH